MTKTEIEELKEVSRLWRWLQKIDSEGNPKRDGPLRRTIVWSHLYRSYPTRDSFNQEVARLSRAKLVKTWVETKMGERMSYETEMMQLTDPPKGWSDDD